MNRFIASFLTLCLFLWVLPLGNFIKPSQEKMACGGGRAMHMCTMGMAKMHTDNDGTSKISFSNASSVDKANKPSSGSGGSDFVDMDALLSAGRARSEFFDHQAFISYQTFILSQDPVPKI